MKKMTLMLSVVACALVLTSCASKGTADQTTTPEPVAPAHHGHHDYKGEVK